MYFRNVLCTVAFATLASAAVAKQIPTPYSSESELYDDTVDDDIFERDAEADPARVAAWEEAHGGPAPSYHYGEERDAAAWHVARDAEAEPTTKPAWLQFLKNKATAASSEVKKVVPTVKPFKTHGGLKKYHGQHHKHGKNTGSHSHARDVEGEDYDEFDDEDYEGIAARNADDDETPDFGDQEIDTSLEGLLEAREVGEDEEDFEDEFDLERRSESEDNDDDEEAVNESEQDLSGYDEEILQRRSDGSEEEIDYSLEGMEDVDLEEQLQARDLNEEDQAEYDAYLRSEEHRSLLESIGVTKRDVEDDIEDEEEFDEQLYARQAEDDDVPDFGDVEVDTSLEGLLEAREVGDDDEVDEEEGADAAYDNAEVVEELVAPPLE